MTCWDAFDFSASSTLANVDTTLLSAFAPDRVPNQENSS